MNTVKFIQIAATGVEENQSTQCECFLFGLTSEGEVYFTDNRDRFNKWNRISPPTSIEHPE